MTNKAIRVASDRLELVMKFRRMNNVELAAAMEMHQNGILKIKREETTTLSTLTRLCQVLECHPFDLLVADGFPEPILMQVPA